MGDRIEERFPDQFEIPQRGSSLGNFDVPKVRRRTLSVTASFSPEASKFVSNLDNYLSLGSLCCKGPAEQDNQDDFLTWKDIEYLPFTLDLHERLVTSLQKLTAAAWIRMRWRRDHGDSHLIILRLYILPYDVGQRFVDRQSRRLHLALESLVTEIDVSKQTWEGQFEPGKAAKLDPYASPDDGSLFLMFNELQSPSPHEGAIKETYARQALEDLLDPEFLSPGLKTTLYPYQRRSAGLMLQRESVSTLDLDPRTEERTAPDGSTYYFESRNLQFYRHPRYYEACKGGILAETMGLGKTVICLAVILATKDHLL